MKRILTFLYLLLPFISVAQGGTEIYLFDLKFSNNQFSLSNPVNITMHKGYDSQPFFHPQYPIVYYASANDSGRTDIKAYDYSKYFTRQITNTSEREYSPTVTPDGYNLSCIIQRDNGQQDLGQYMITGGNSPAKVLIDNLKVGYHTWIDANSLLLFVLADSTNNLHEYNLATSETTIIARKPGRSLHKIPNQQAFSFIDKSSADQWVIKQFDPATKAISPIINTFGKSEDICWTTNGYILTSDGEKLYACKPQSGKAWQQVDTKDLPMLKKITRMAVNKETNRLAVVVSE
ncbi:hypothetical protein [Emticicia sp. BO119]|uniref:TolB family protein n=1 Tax=Emticicia sp. BO119 TaxID=2757768 RepID=UPI0015F0F814|nr:hypothetical protein [Emticicia sp. BO119]MBA4851095.1 hypothetical protein [Emticicia sp. BO119]